MATEPEPPCFERSRSRNANKMAGSLYIIKTVHLFLKNATGKLYFYFLQTLIRKIRRKELENWTSINLTLLQLQRCRIIIIKSYSLPFCTRSRSRPIFDKSRREPGQALSRSIIKRQRLES